MADLANLVIEDGVRRVAKAGAELVLLCSNTAHTAAKAVSDDASLPPLLHIGDAVAVRVKALGASRVGLLGTQFTMTPTSAVVERLRLRGLDVVLPGSERRRVELQTLIETSLSLNVVRDEDTQFLLECVRDLDVDVVVLGCTELGMALTQSDVDSASLNVQLIDSTLEHVNLASQWQFGEFDLESFDWNAN